MNLRKRKSILHLFASPSWGGGEQYVYDLTEKLLENNFRVRLVSRKSDIIPIKAARIKCPVVRISLKNPFDLFSIIKIKWLIEFCSVDVVHTHQFKDTFIALFARMLSDRKPKVVLTRHLVKPAKKNVLYSYLYRNTDKIIFISELAKNVFLSTGPDIDEKKITVIHNSIPLRPAEEDAVPLRRKYDLPPDVPILAYIGRLDPEKGLETLIDAVATLQWQDFVLLIAGKGDPEYERELDKKVYSMGLDEKIVFAGFIDNVPEFIRQTDVGVVPSVCREAFGLSVVEFMQAGKAVITTNNGAQKEFVTNGEDGILVPPSDPQALASAIRKLIGNRELRELIGENARKKARKDLSYEDFYRKITDVYNEGQGF